MATVNLQPSSDAAFDEDIARLEIGIKRLKVHYDMFFVGSLAREPIEIRSQVEKLIRRHAESSKLKYAQRFRFNSLVSRFNSLSELWSKTTRRMEEGDTRHRTKLDQFDLRERLIARARMRKGEDNGDADSLQRLYDKFIEARQVNGEDSRKLSYKNFVRGISSQTQRLRKETDCAEIELRVVLRDQKVQVKARPGR
jgi:hypothetical protein